MNQIKLQLYDLIIKDEEIGMEYFVDNDFYNNKYTDSNRRFYYCIKERDVSEYKNIVKMEILII